MPIHVALHHRSHYSYDRPVGHLPHIVRLRPAPHCRTSILSYALRILPPQHFLNWQQDPFSNYLARLVFPEKSTELLIEVDLVAEMAVFNPFDYFLEPSAETFPIKYEPSVRKELAPFLEAPPATPLLNAFLNSIDRTEARTNDFLVSLNRRLSQEIKYLIRLEPGVQLAEDRASVLVEQAEGIDLQGQLGGARRRGHPASSLPVAGCVVAMRFLD